MGTLGGREAREQCWGAGPRVRETQARTGQGGRWWQISPPRCARHKAEVAESQSSPARAGCRGDQATLLAEGG